MESPTNLPALLEAAPRYREKLATDLREIVLANVIMCGEIPSPTFEEDELVRFVCDRFTESDLSNISVDECGNAEAILPGTGNDPAHRKQILVAAHADKIWPVATDHTVTVEGDRMAGAGIADNSLGVAALVSLPEILQKLGIRLKSDLILLGTSRSFGRGDLGGIRFFLQNIKSKIDAAICVEGMQLDRLSYSSLGMLRGEITVTVPTLGRSGEPKTSGAIAPLNRIIEQLMAIERPERPVTSILLGSIEAGSTYNSPPRSASLKFEVRSEREDIVVRIKGQIEEIIAEINARQEADAELQIIARRKPGDIGFSHPLVTAARNIMGCLGVEPAVEPSISELSALLDEGIPALTLGLTYGSQRHTLEESIQIEPLFTGLAQLVTILQVLDSDLCENEQA